MWLRCLLHFSASDFYLPIYAEVCKRLADVTPVKGGRARAYLGNSGTEVVETAIKLARHATGRPYVVAFLGAFHGRSYGSVSLTASKSKYHAGFGPLLPGVYHAPFGGGQAHKAFALAAGLQLLVDALTPHEGFGAVLLVARPERDPVPGFRRLAEGVRLPGDR